MPPGCKNVIKLLGKNSIINGNFIPPALQDSEKKESYSKF